VKIKIIPTLRVKGAMWLFVSHCLRTAWHSPWHPFQCGHWRELLPELAGLWGEVVVTTLGSSFLCTVCDIGIASVLLWSAIVAPGEQTQGVRDARMLAGPILPLYSHGTSTKYEHSLLRFECVLSKLMWWRLNSPIHLRGGLWEGLGLDEVVRVGYPWWL
jgi:hypothetical protein